MENLEMKKGWLVFFDRPKSQAILLSVIILFNVALAFVLILSPVTSIKGGEPSVVYTIQSTMLNKTMMYSDPEVVPFSATQYSPLYYIIASTAASLLSLTPGEDVVPIYRVARFISFLSSLGIAYFIFLLLTNVFR